MPEPPVRQDAEKRTAFIMAAIAGGILVLFLLYLFLRQIYIDTHCTTILGTRICR